MSDTHEVISAFLDDEPFDAQALAEALGDPAGRELLIDLIALRCLTQHEATDTPASTVRKPWRSSLRALAAVAAVLVALVGGYVAGERRAQAATSAAPAATRVVQTPGVWQDVPAAGRLP